MIWDRFRGLDLYHADPAQHLITAGEDPDDLDRDLSDLSVRHVKRQSLRTVPTTRGHTIPGRR